MGRHPKRSLALRFVDHLIFPDFIIATGGRGHTFLRDLLQEYVSPYAVAPSTLKALLSYIINRQSSFLTAVLLNIPIWVARDTPARRERLIKVS